MKILYVEGDAKIRATNIAELTVEFPDIELHVAPDPAEAMEVLGKNELFDAIISNIYFHDKPISPWDAGSIAHFYCMTLNDSGVPRLPFVLYFNEKTASALPRLWAGGFCLDTKVFHAEETPIGDIIRSLTGEAILSRQECFLPSRFRKFHC